MKIRADLALVSSVLLTLALLWLKPIAMWNFYATTDKAALARLDPGYQYADRIAHGFGVACLVIIFIGLIVIWTGYVRRSRSAWLVMAVITWAWAFPLFALPRLKEPRIFTLPEWLYNAIYGPGPTPTPSQAVVIFALMVIALLLPIKSIFFAKRTSAPTQGPSLKLLSRFAVAVLLIVIALLVWIHVQVYELPLEQLSGWMVAPPPPPPPPIHASNGQ